MKHIMNHQTLYKSETGRNAILNHYNKLLGKCTVPYEEMVLDTSYGKTYVIASGEPSLPALILLHGSGSNSSMWIGDIARYSKHYRVFAVDIPGDPGKSEEKQYPLKSPAYSEWMDDVLHALQVDKASFMGISLGAWMATHFAVKHPEKVEKLVLLSPSGIGPQKISFLFKAMPFLLFGEKGRDKVSRLVNGNQTLPEDALLNTKIIARHFRFRSETVPIFTDSELRRLTIPILLLAGEQDVMLHSKKTVERLSSLLPHANATLLADCGHVLMNQSTRIMPFLLNE
ncbi:Ndr family protein [Brevibacillus reuszeri]|uniref:Ndr family protein n=2 Tax=Brevibacillus reuszeri TaxID=54915 RepID=A0ABQ0TWV1_9BACL|nr:alpha/beta hydrolase [Brevibacillus reuszeri]MED1855849.1 alpha/beta hydrolase [Brevibacillus reuszeri]GED72185.1 Ndr family protein [Brevibacillus reuszeri]